MPASASTPARLTVAACIQQVAQQFRAARLHFGHGTFNANDEAAWLVAHSCDITHEALAGCSAQTLTAAQTARVQRRMRQRIETRQPLAYILGEAWLGDLRFVVDPRVIVPRSFIAELLREQLTPWVQRPGSIRHALDLCTGSGCLAILMAHAFPKASVIGSELSAGALQVARRNVRLHQLQHRVQLLRSDLFDQLPASHAHGFDLIVSNPPYVNARSMATLPAEYRHEPQMALASGSDGFDLLRRLLREASAWLRPNGLLVVEVGHARARVERAFPQLPMTWLDTSAGDDCVFLLHQEDLAR
jgi:ribosomal protein L3 glutamine methyltransferase